MTQQKFRVLAEVDPQDGSEHILVSTRYSGISDIYHFYREGGSVNRVYYSRTTATFGTYKRSAGLKNTSSITDRAPYLYEAAVKQAEDNFAFLDSNIMYGSIQLEVSNADFNILFALCKNI